MSLVFPVAPGTAVDLSGEEWLSALEYATAPRVFPPAETWPCLDVIRAPLYEESARPLASPTLELAQIQILESEEALRAYAAVHGLRLSLQEETALIGAGNTWIAMSYDLSRGNGWTLAMRTVAPSTESAPQLGLLGKGLPVTLFVIGDHAVGGEQWQVANAASLDLMWFAKQGASDFEARRREAHSAGIRLWEQSGLQTLYQWTVLPREAGTQAPVVESYFARSRDSGVIAEDVTDCLGRVHQARFEGSLGALVSLACAPGRLHTSQGEVAPCDAVVPAEAIDAEQLGCGEADDLALALAGHQPDEVRISRLSFQSLSEPSIWIQAPEEEISKVLLADYLDSRPCAGLGSSATPTQPGISDQNSDSAMDDSHEQHETAEVDGEGCAAWVNSSCSGDSSGDGGCSGDSGSTDDDGCGGDSNYEGDGCSGGSSYDDDGCGGDSNYEGD